MGSESGRNSAIVVTCVLGIPWLSFDAVKVTKSDPSVLRIASIMDCDHARAYSIVQLLPHAERSLP
jgi:hypothetical protein